MLRTVETTYATAYVCCPGCGDLVAVQIPVDVWVATDGAHPRVSLASDWDSPVRGRELETHSDDAAHR
jgi:hypothetical protein